MSSLVEFKKSLEQAMAKYAETWVARCARSNENLSPVASMTPTELNEIFSLVLGHSYNDQQFYGGRHYFVGWMPSSMINNTHRDHAEQYKFMIENRSKSMLWYAYMNALEISGGQIYSTSVRWDKVTTSTEEQRQPSTEEVPAIIGYQNQNLYILLKTMHDVKIERANLLAGMRVYKSKLSELKYSHDLLEGRSEDAKKPKSIETLFKDAPKADKDVIESQLADAIKRLPSNGLTARTWGFEVEVPDAKGVEVLSNSGIEKGEDGSLRSYETEDCDCGCSSCVYHDCNCDNCSDYNDDPQHDCGSSDCTQADMAEFRTTGGIQRVKHSGLYKLCKELNDVNAEKNDTAGTHIHVYAADLTTNQVGHVLAIYKFTEAIMSKIAGRYDVHYASATKSEHVAAALKKNNPTLANYKPTAVNVSHLLLNAWAARGTIEFRQMNCNLDADRITIWAWLVRGLVSAAKRGARLTNFLHIKDLNDIIDVLAKFDHTVENENPEDVIFGSKSDKYMFEVQTHKS